MIGAIPPPQTPPRGFSWWANRNLPPLRYAARKERSAPGRVPPIGYPDNPPRINQEQPLTLQYQAA
jgi:hypothetical protein